MAIERVVPGETCGRTYLEHLARYEFAARFVRGMRVLDVACGSGYGAQVLCGAGACEYLGVDISEEALRLARSRYRVADNVSFLRGDACSLDKVAGGPFDVIVSFETIEHLLEPERFLAKVHEALTPCGKFIVSTPNRSYSNPSGTLTSEPTNPYHIREWAVREFVALLARSFKVEEIMGQGTYPYWKFLGRRLAKRNRLVEWLAARYRAIGPSKSEASPCIDGPPETFPVQRVSLWNCPAFVVCLCTVARRS